MRWNKNRKTFDHGVWSILSIMFENLNVPVIQLSLPTSYSKEEFINLGELLGLFKDEALLIASGGLTHNLRDMSHSSEVKKIC